MGGERCPVPRQSVADSVVALRANMVFKARVPPNCPISAAVAVILRPESSDLPELPWLGRKLLEPQVS